MSQFLKVADESMWVNLDRVEAVLIRPELKAVGSAHGEGALEELHESTGAFEVVIVLQGQMVRAATFPSRAQAEQEVMRFIGSRIL